MKTPPLGGVSFMGVVHLCLRQGAGKALVGHLNTTVLSKKNLKYEAK
jgi:hypothetical protein